MQRYANFVTRHPLLLLLVLAALSLVALQGMVDLRSGALKISVDPSLDRLMPEDDAERKFYDRARQLFGSDEFMLLVLEADDIFSADTLARIVKVTTRLEQERDVLRVLSLANAKDVVGADGEIVVGPFFEEVPTTALALEALRKRVQAHPVFGDALVSHDNRAAAIIVFFEKIDDRDFIARNVSNRLTAIAEEAAGTTLCVTGNPHIKTQLSRTIVRELGIILPLVAGIAALLCAWAFRSWRGVLLPLGAIAISLLWTLGAMGWTGTSINLVSNIIPPLLITLGFAASLHVMAEYFEALQHEGSLDRAANTAAVHRVLSEMGLAILVNGVTTVLGFLSLCTSTVLAIRQFGVWSVFGVLAATVTSLVFIPAMLALLGAPHKLAPKSDAGALEHFAERVGAFDIRHRRAIFVGAFVALVLATYGISKLYVSSSFVGSFVPSSSIRTTFEALNERMGGLNSFFIVVEADEDRAFLRPQNLRELERLQRWLEAQPEIGSTASFVDGVKLLNQAFAENDPAAFTIPRSAGAVDELLLFGGDEVTQGFVDRKMRTANIQVRTKVSGSHEVRAFLERLRARTAELPRRLQAKPTGDLILLSHTMDDITQGMFVSSFTAFCTIYLTLALLLTSFRVGFFALLPNLVPVAIYYGALGLTGTPLNLTTSLIGAITLGIAVDDTVHYFARFALEARRLGDEKRATVSTLRSVIRPVSFITLGLCLGFLALTASELQAQVEFGILSAATMFVGWLLELTLSPAICSSIRLVTLWDLLSLDLGHEPQLSIPLFRGLSKREARVFALMSRMVSLNAGEKLFSEGEKGHEMFIVIDGELTAGINRDNKYVEFARMRRGEVVGEIALFSAARTADVDATQNARLLRFGMQDLDRLKLRYPRIAATIFSNLMEVLAGRIQNTIKTLR